MDTDKSVDPIHKKKSIETVRWGLQDEEARQNSKNFACFSDVLCNANSSSCKGVGILMSVGWWSEGKPLKLRHYDISRAHFQGMADRLVYVRVRAEDRQQHGEDKVGGLIQSMHGTQDASHILQRDHVNLICWEPWRFPTRQTQCNIGPQCKIGCKDGCAL